MQDREDMKVHSATVSLLLGPLAFLYLLPLAAALRLFGIFGAILFDSKEIEAEEGEGESSELERMLRRGRLKSADLVFVDGGWQTFQQSMAFEDVCFQLEQQSRLFRLAASGLAILGGSCLLVWLVWGIFSFPEWVMSLGR